MKQKQIYYEDTNIGDMLPQLIKHPTPRQMVMWAGVSGDYYEIHYDHSFAIKLGLPDILVQGGLVASFLGQMITDWMGKYGTLKKFQTFNKQMVLPHQDIICGGKIIQKYKRYNLGLVECEIWAEDYKGSKLVEGNATMALPESVTIRPSAQMKNQ